MSIYFHSLPTFVFGLCHIRGNLVVIEWKTSQRRKSSLKEAYDDPIQLAAYIGNGYMSTLVTLCYV